jgi:hypothetical protein
MFLRSRGFCRHFRRSRPGEPSGLPQTPSAGEGTSAGMLRRSCFIEFGGLRYPPLDPSLRGRSFYQRLTQWCHPLTDYSSAFFTHQGHPMWADIHADDQSVSGYFLQRTGQLQPMESDGRGPGEGIGGPRKPKSRAAKDPVRCTLPGRGGLGEPGGFPRARSTAQASEAASSQKQGPIKAAGNRKQPGRQQAETKPRPPAGTQAKNNSVTLTPKNHPAKKESC